MFWCENTMLLTWSDQTSSRIFLNDFKPLQNIQFQIFEMCFPPLQVRNDNNYDNRNLHFNGEIMGFIKSITDFIVTNLLSTAVQYIVDKNDN